MKETMTEPKTTIEPTPQEAEFGCLIWRWIKAQTREGGMIDGPDVDEIMSLAEAAGLCGIVVYDPERHGEIAEAEPGSEIWWWGKAEPRAEGGAG